MKNQNKPDKNALRRALLADRQAIDREVRRQWDATIGARVCELLARCPVHTLGVYWPIRSEPDLRAIYGVLAAQGMQLALPVVIERDMPLGFAAWTPGEALVKDAMGVSVPTVQTHVEPDALLIPCVGFNSANLRLGYGGGFYDRTLALDPRPYAIGIAYACAAAEFDGDAHDVALDVVVTENSPSV
jgi:5,10-methenyltetrahydrofolate synthetase